MVGKGDIKVILGLEKKWYVVYTTICMGIAMPICGN